MGPIFEISVKIPLLFPLKRPKVAQKSGPTDLQFVAQTPMTKVQTCPLDTKEPKTIILVEFEGRGIDLPTLNKIGFFSIFLGPKNPE